MVMKRLFQALILFEKKVVIPVEGDPSMDLSGKFSQGLSDLWHSYNELIMKSKRKSIQTYFLGFIKR
jgi:hypothetical protein